MAVTIKHAKTDNIADWTQADLDAQIALGNYPAGTVLADIVLPSDWNNDHTLSGTVPIANGGTGQTTANAALNALLPSQSSQSGKVLSTDGSNTSWIAAGGTGTVTSVTGTAPVSVATGTTTPVISMAAANTTTNGYLTSTDWNTFNGKAPATSGTSILYGNGSGGFSNVTVGSGLSFSTGTLSATGGSMVYPGAGIPNSTGTAWGTSYTTTGTGTVVALQTAASLNNPTISNYADWGNGSATTLAAGRMWYNGSTGSWNLGMGNGNITQQVGEELFVYGKASSAITDSPLQIVYHTGTVGASGVITFAPTIAGITDENAIIGVATESIALNGFGRVTTFGVVNGITTNGSAFGETWADDDVIWYNPVTGNPTKVKPSAPNIKFQIGTVIKAGSGGSGSFQVSLVQGTQLGGTDSNVTLTSPTNGQILTYDTSNTYWKNTSLTAGTGISVSAATGGTLTVTNSAPDQTVSITGTGGAIVTGTYPSFTINTPSGTVTSVTGTAPVVSSGGATPAISMAAASSSTNGYLTSTDWTTFNSKGSGTVTSVSATSPVTSTGGATPTIAMPAATTSVSGYLTSTDWTTFNNKGSGTVTSVAALTLGTTGTDLSSTVATGTTTPVITLNVPTASASNRGVLSSADWTTFNNKGSGTVTSVTGTSPVVSSGGATPAISMAAANTSTNGYLTSTDWNTFNGKGSGTVTSASVVSANGFAGTVATATTTPAITISTSITGVLKGNATAISAATAGTDYVAPGTATTFTAAQTFNGSSSVLAAVFANAAETTTISATAATGTINYDVTTQSVIYYTSNASANWTVNFRASSGTSLNTALATGQSITVVFLVTQGATAYYNNAITIDGTSVTPKYQGGTAWSAGNASGIDAYSYTIVKTGSAAFTVFAAQTQFK